MTGKDLANLCLGLFGLYSGGKVVARTLGFVGDGAAGEAHPGGGPVRRLPPSPAAARPRGRAASDDEIRVEHHQVENLAERVGYIIRMIRRGKSHPRIRELAVKLVSQRCGDVWCTPEKNWAAEVVTIFTWYRRHVRYVRDTYGEDLFQHPRRTIGFGGGDCDDATITLGALLQAIGFEIRLRVIRTVDAEDWNHIYLLVLIPAHAGAPFARWIALDGSVARPAGWEAPRRMIAAIRDFAVPA